MNKTPQEIIEKLQKLLRLSESANEHESALALQRAQELALRYKIELSTVAEQDKPVDPMGRQLREYKSKSMAHRYICWIVDKHFDVDLVYAGGNKRRIWYIGRHSDVEFAKYVFDFLNAEFPRLFKIAARAQGWNQADVGNRTNYYYGLYRGLDAKLAESKRVTEAQVIREVSAATGRDASQSYALAVQNNALAVQSAKKTFFPNLRPARRSSVNVRNSDAVAQGRADGRRINISRPLCGGGRAAGQLT